MKPIVFESNPSFWFETLRSFSHPATAELQQRTGQRPLGAAAALAVRLWLLHVQSPPGDVPKFVEVKRWSPA
jgi:hypothetical protein